MTISLAMGQRIRQRANIYDDGTIQRARRLWMRGGWHPPSHNPKQKK